MKTIVIRFVVVYFFLLIAMKIMGKRQIGQMQMSELIAAFFLSDLACYTVTEVDFPMYYGLIIIFLMILLEMTISYLAVKKTMVKHVLDFAPSLIIREGVVLEKELLKNRLTIDELFSLLRLGGCYNLSDVRFAILEPNGQISMIPYAKRDVLTPEDLGITVSENGFSVAVIDDGVVNEKALKAIGKDEKWLRSVMNENEIQNEKEIFLMASDFLGSVKIIRKEK